MHFQKRSIESILSILILVILVLIGAGIYFKQYRYDFSTLTQAETENKAAQISRLELSAPAGFVGADKTETFDSDNLYSKIDGKADLYLDSGFKQLDCRIFKSSADPNQWMEMFVYDMNTPKNALAVFGVQRRPEGESIGIADFAYKTPDSIFFAQGKYYVELTGSLASEQLLGAMQQAGTIFVKNVGSQAGQIEELSAFPKENLVGQSFKLYVSSAYGYEGFKELYAATYKTKDSDVTAFICKRPDGASAQKLANDYRKFLVDNGGTARTSSNPNLSNAVFDMAGEFEIVFSKGPFVGGVHQVEKQDDAEAVASMLLERLAK